MTGRSLRYAVLRLLFVVISIALNIVLIGRLHWGVTGIFLANVAANLAVLSFLMSDVVPNFRPALLRTAQWRALWLPVRSTT